MLEELLHQSAFFSALPAEALTELASRLAPSTVPAGTMLFCEGCPGDGFYVIIEGQVEIVKAQQDLEQRVIAQRGPGDHIGEMSLLERDGVHMATARAATSAVVVHVSRSDFNLMLQSYPQLSFQIAKVIASRLTQAQTRALRELEEQNRQLRIALAELQAAQAELLEKKQLERELALARDIQMSMLPVHLPSLPPYEFGAVLHPMSQVGGDFYDLIPLGDGRVGVAIGDVSGHGMPAALIMAVTVALLRAEATRDCSPAEVLRNVNRALLNVNSGRMFVTVLYGVLDAGSGHFAYARAGHELPLLLRGDGTAAYLEGGRGRMLGLFENVVLEDVASSVGPGELLLLYTDGVTEARDSAGEFFGEERLVREAADGVTAGPQALCERLLALVGSHSGAHAQDDITLVALARPPAEG